MKFFQVLIRWIFILSLPALLISASLAWGFNSLWLYEYGFRKYDVSQTTGLNSQNLQIAATGLIHYFNSGAEYVNITVQKDGSPFELFNTDEQLHFKDVKGLVWLDYKVLVVSLIIAAGYILTSIFWRRGRYRATLARSALWGSGLTLLLILFLGIASLLDFNQLFLDFHEAVFTNNYWSTPGYMLLLFPGGFWQDATLICAGFVAAGAIIIGALSAIYLMTSKSAIKREESLIQKENAPNG